MLDVSRNFKPKNWILKFLDVMAMYKMNKLHLHLTDDESWRIEIPDLPELTQVHLLFPFISFTFRVYTHQIFLKRRPIFQN